LEGKNVTPHRGGGGSEKCHQMSPGGEGGGLKSVKKCHVLFEWPLTQPNNSLFFAFPGCCWYLRDGEEVFVETDERNFDSNRRI
jgi:hypothetical protein